MSLRGVTIVPSERDAVSAGGGRGLGEFSCGGLATTDDGEITDLRTELPAGAGVPETLGRYRLGRVLGAGGMGVVYAAEDPKLGRKLALKVLAPRLGGATARARMEREARLLAKLAHPNVVAVHDVGEQEGRLYIAMELVEGQTLRRWLESRARAWPEVLAIFLAAGRGLVAAHEASLVHRDFKPDNVLVDEQGVARVVDFGLARRIPTAAEAVAETERSATVVQPALSATGGTITHGETILGTPAYMAPEQHLGETSDARTDQFAFCVALWEALYRESPFAGRSTAALADAVISGRIARSPHGGVPRAFRPLLVRGLSVDPDRRWPTLSELLAELSAIPLRRRRRRAVGIVGIVGASSLSLLAVIGTLAAGRGETAACASAGASVDTLWNDERRGSIAAAIDRLDPEAGTLRANVLEGLDLYAAGLREELGRLCLDTAAGDRDALGLTGRRQRCYELRRSALGSTVTLIEELDREGLSRARVLLSELPPLSQCADIDYLETRLTEPAGPEAARLATEAREALVRGRAAIFAGEREVAAEALDRAEQLANAAAHPPISAEIELARGGLAEMHGDVPGAAQRAEAVYYRALAIGYDELALEAAFMLLRSLTHIHRDIDGAQAWIRHATALTERLGDELARGRLLDARAALAQSSGDMAAAVLLHRESLAIKEAELGPDHLELAYTLNDLGLALDMLDRPQEARAVLERALAIRLRGLGEYAPQTGVSLGNLGLVFESVGDYETALVYQRRSLVVHARAFGERHVSAAGIRLNIAINLNYLDRAEEALAVLHRGLELAGALTPPQPMLTAMLQRALGDSERSLGRGPEAHRAYGAALAIIEEVAGGDSEECVPLLLGLAFADNLRERHTEAIAHGEGALARIGEEESDERRGYAHQAIAEAHLALGQRDLALASALAARARFAAMPMTSFAAERREIDELLRRLGAGAGG